MEIEEILSKKDLTSEKAYYSGIAFLDMDRVKSTFYSGDLLLSNNNKMKDDDFEHIINDFLSNPNQDWFATLSDSICHVVGENNAHRVGGGFGKNDFHISFHFRKTNFWEIINKLKDYFSYLELDDIVDFYDSTSDNPKDCKWILFSEYKKK